MRWIALVTAAVLAVPALVLGLRHDGGSSASAAPAAAPLRVDHFDVARAWRLVELQLEAGQRPAGSPQLRALATRLRPLLPGGRFEPVAGQPGVRNIVGTLPGRAPAIVVGAHYDTLAAPKGFVGANNGAAGTAEVIELSRALAKLPRPADARAVTFVLFDGEEPAQGTPEQHADFYDVGLRGSRAYVAAHPGATADMVLLDYVGNRGLRLPREATSSTSLWALLRSSAAHVGASAFFPGGTGPEIIDDHTPFLHAGVRAVDLIDWSYAGHAVTDRLDQLSRASLDAVGETVLDTIQELRKHP